MTMVNDEERKRRNAMIAGLRELARWLEIHPDVPVPYDITASLYVQAYGRENEDAFGDGEVGRIAGLMGSLATFHHREGDESRATVEFGGGVAYSVAYLHRKRRDEYAAGASYLRSVQPAGGAS